MWRFGFVFFPRFKGCLYFHFWLCQHSFGSYTVFPVPIGWCWHPRKLPQRAHLGLYIFLSQLSKVLLHHFAVTQGSRWSLNSWIESKMRMKNGRSWGQKEQVNIGREQLQWKLQYDIPIYLAAGLIITITPFILPVSCHLSWVFEW